ncbi:alpha-amylase [Bacteroidia bacterium]|nr:alpha-amylase [Bacteroidia bacterium]
MKKKLLLIFMFPFIVLNFIVAQSIDKVEPLFWWCGMKNPELQLMVYGKNIGEYRPSINYPGVFLKGAISLESPNYLILYLDVANAKPGTFDITFTHDKKKITYPYELKARKESTADIHGYDSSDVLYLLMPDRFSNGDPSNDQPPMKGTYKVDRKEKGSRHGGDLLGIENHLDYFDDLGVTAIWLNPVLENDANRGSYHGYFATDLYHIDRRLGTNEDYVRLIDKAHKKGLRVVMDMIFNHIGPLHPWVLDVPAKDWFSVSPSPRGNHAKEIYYDNYASKYDSDVMKYAGFNVDVNQANPHVGKYFIQNSIWWIEYARVDAIRQDTYPYADFDMMREWNIQVMNEYPQFNIVGEIWTNYTIGTAWWQKGSKLNTGKDTELKSVMDFTLMGMASDVFHDKSPNGRLSKIYEHLCYDFVYPNINNLLRFLENHDTDRYLREMPTDLRAYKQGLAFLLTIPGTPQLYYGMELLMNGTKSAPGGDGNIRLDMPGGWAEDTQNWFVRDGRSAIQNEAWDYVHTLLKWRRGNEVISAGKMIHFMPNLGVYVYERSLNGKSVLVFLNGADKEVTLPLDRYTEVLHGKTKGTDVITKRSIALEKNLVIAAKDVLILEM